MMVLFSLWEKYGDHEPLDGETIYLHTYIQKLSEMISGKITI